MNYYCSIVCTVPVRAGLLPSVRANVQIDKEKFASKGKNTPFHGREVQGRVKATIVKGKVVFYKEEE